MSFKNWYSKINAKIAVMSALIGLKRGEYKDITQEVKKGLYEVLLEKFDQDEKESISGIERLRKFLNSSSSKIQILTNYNSPGDEKDRYRLKSMTIGEVSERSSIKYLWATILFKMIRAFRPDVCFELGTNIGISAAYQASALKLNNKGQLVTFELSDSKAKLANENFQKLKLDNARAIAGRFSDTVENELKKFKTIDYAFIDGHHDEKATIDYFDLIEPYLSKKSFIVFDDINWSGGMRRAWDQLKNDKRFVLSVDLTRLGICFVRK